jgi:hypothetical protein
VAGSAVGGAWVGTVVGTVVGAGRALVDRACGASPGVAVPAACPAHAASVSMASIAKHAGRKTRHAHLAWVCCSIYLSTYLLYTPERCQ